ncbi:hypothetical protein KC19_3G165000 [Ceratodon purpureus]|uniref:Uncharacterized protein n=1 Tax=Ceratodon purpureus TaxID=3225 RepID=A0A8T0ILM2_CERPU|nr:hypothetical protein KC19_3G165000 [Ceratodon purpureus]
MVEGLGGYREEHSLIVFPSGEEKRRGDVGSTVWRQSVEPSLCFAFISAIASARGELACCVERRSPREGGREVAAWWSSFRCSPASEVMANYIIGCRLRTSRL